MSGVARKHKTILAVEDDPVIRKAIQKALEGQAEVVFAATGKAALEALAQPAAPAFVLLDLMLPDMDGLQVLGKVRSEPRTQILPVVMFSSTSDSGRVRTALMQGANSWVRKEDDPRAFEAAVQDVCKYWLHLHTAP
jgi:CheY-like chemotaxis protein